ncbi:MAG TPA: FecR domain-containing protein [Terriglobales bacterium]|nr:FecR domain-containing protein [Terriglobales bacterium]
MRLSRLQATAASLFLAAVLVVPAWGANSGTHSALPGTLNYVEGQASIGNQTLDAKSVGTAELQAGQTLTTDNGKAEILLTPGVFLRLGADSSLSMVSPNLTSTELALHQGEAMVEVDQIYKENDIRIAQNGATVQLLKVGLYDFDAAHQQVRVFDGKAVVRDGDRTLTLKAGREVALNGEGRLKATSFDKKVAEVDDLYRWSSLRSDYLAEANVDAARVYVVNGWYGPGWLGAGWYYNPWWGAYTFLPARGFLYSPFGWGFYSPLFVGRAPALYGYGHYVHTFDGFHPAPARGPGFHDYAVRSFGRGESAPVGAMHGSGGFRGAGFGAFR